MRTKSWFIGLFSLILFLSAALPSFAAASTKTESTPSVKVISKFTTPTNNIPISSHPIEAQGVKKWLVVQALKYGGPLLGELLEMLSPAAGEALTEWAYTLGVELDALSSDIEANLIDFMIFDLDLPQSVARSIAWAICQLAL
ncbi:hypothetical protein D3C73_478210 [compost metagenome]